MHTRHSNLVLVPVPRRSKHCSHTAGYRTFRVRRKSKRLKPLSRCAAVHVQPASILETAAKTPALSTLVTAVQAASAGIQTALTRGPITVFAPVNSAFAKLDPTDLSTLLVDQPALDGVLGYHVAPGEALSADLKDGQNVKMANGGTVTVSIDKGAVSLIDGAGGRSKVVAADIRLGNGTVHLIDSVLMVG